MALSPYALTTLQTAREHLGIPVGVVQYDSLIERLINEATAKIETYCDRIFVQRSITEDQDGFAQNRLLFNQWPGEKPTELWIDCSGEFTDTTKRLDADDYMLDVSARGEGVGVVLKGGRSFPNGVKNIRLVYLAGYAEIPADLEGACLWAVQFAYDMRSSGSVGVASKGKNQENVTFRGEFPQYVTATLDAYRRFEFPLGDRPLSTR